VQEYFFDWRHSYEYWSEHRTSAGKKTGVDLFSNTGSIWPLLPFRLAKRQLAFIHDVIPLLFPECYYKHTRYYYRLSRAIHLNTLEKILVTLRSQRETSPITLEFMRSRFLELPWEKTALDNLGVIFS